MSQKTNIAVSFFATDSDTYHGFPKDSSLVADILV